jgi:hypothetical protein
MSNDLKNKMYNYEVTPPDTSWEYIAHSLDEQSIQKNISEKLYPYEIAPPATAWSNIVNAIDLELSETKFRNKALSLEVQPPSFAWNKIAEELDAQPLNNFSKRIYEYQVDPPVNSWKKIITVLDEEQTAAPVIPINKNYSRIYRIAAAAAIIGIITWAGFSLFSNTKDNNENNSIANENPKTVAPAAPVTETKEDIVSDAIKTEITSSITAANNPVARVTPANNYSKKRLGITSKNPVGQTYDLAASEIHSGSDDITIADAESLHTKKKSVTGNTENTTEARYLVYLTEQGDIVKLSKKLVDLKCIYTKEGNVNQDALSKLDASQCIDQVKYWQEKMANSSLQSSSNPLELIEILK